MTVGKLHKILTKLIAAGHARKPVAIDKDWFNHHLETDGVRVLHVDKAKLELIHQVDGDGHIKINAGGSEAMRQLLVLRGDNSFNYRTHEDAATEE